jgi:TolA-binding protein
MQMKYNKILSLVFMGLVIASCSSPQQKMKSEIQEQEKAFYASQPGDANLAEVLISSYVSYVDDYPSDIDAPEFLFKAADIAMNMNKPQQAIKLFQRIIGDYPDFDKLPQCLFLQGYIYENNLGNLQKAKEIYQEFLEKYPNDEFADDAEVSLQNLGKSPEQLIREFEEKSKEKE